MNKKKIIIVISAIAALLLGFGIYKGVTYIKSYNQLKEINEDNKENETIKEKATIKEVTSENVTEDDKKLHIMERNILWIMKASIVTNLLTEHCY